MEKEVKNLIKQNGQYKIYQDNESAIVMIQLSDKALLYSIFKYQYHPDKQESYCLVKKKDKTVNQAIRKTGEYIKAKTKKDAIDKMLKDLEYETLELRLEDKNYKIKSTTLKEVYYEKGRTHHKGSTSYRTQKNRGKKSARVLHWDTIRIPI